MINLGLVGQVIFTFRPNQYFGYFILCALG